MFSSCRSVSIFKFTFAIIAFLFTQLGISQTLAGEYLFISGSSACLRHADVELRCGGIAITTQNEVFDDHKNEDLFCQINAGRQNKQFNSPQSLQTLFSQVTSKEPTEILKKEIWQILNKVDGSLLFTQVDHSLILNPKQETITSSKLITRGKSVANSANVIVEDPVTETQICVYKKYFRF